MSLVAGVDRELAHALAFATGAGHQVDALKGTAGLGDAGAVSLPSGSWRASSSTRTVTENWAETEGGTAMGEGHHRNRPTRGGAAPPRVALPS